MRYPFKLPLTGLVVAAGNDLRLPTNVGGSAPTTLQAKVWREGLAGPTDWLLKARGATALLQWPGSTGFVAFLWSTAGTRRQRCASMTTAGYPRGLIRWMRASS